MPARRPELARFARALAAKMARERMAWSDALAVAVRAAASHLEGRVEESVLLLDEAAAGFDAANMVLMAATARRRKGAIVGGEAGAALVATADAFMAGQRIVRPPRMTAMLMPGLPGLSAHEETQTPPQTQCTRGGPVGQGRDQRGGSKVKDVYGAVVIGSGFGGAVAACRLAQAGIDVAVLERGKRYPKPARSRANYKDLAAGWMWSYGQGLFDVKPLHEMQVVQAAGWGGGSLIYANVHLRPVEDVFASGWPKDYDRDQLDPYYDLVGYMLDIKPITTITKNPGGVLPPKTLLMRRIAGELGRADQFCYPNIAVELEHAGETKPNKFGFPQGGCTQCGECDVGCNVHAKNTLDHNYLALAERAGADVATLAEVCRIEPVPIRRGGAKSARTGLFATTPRVARERFRRRQSESSSAREPRSTRPSCSSAAATSTGLSPPSPESSAAAIRGTVIFSPRRTRPRRRSSPVARAPRSRRAPSTTAGRGTTASGSFSRTGGSRRRSPR